MFAAKKQHVSIVAVLALLLPLGVAQDADEGGLVRVDVLEDETAPGDEAVATRFDREQVITLLTDQDLDRREGSFDALVRSARFDRGVYRLLSEISESRVDLELAWTARLALREVARGPMPFGAFGTADPGWRSLLQQEGMGDLDQLWGPGLENLRVWGLQDVFPGIFGGPPQGAGEIRNVEIQQDEQGVTLRIHETVDGETQPVREYRGESIEAILDANPELHEEMEFQGEILPGGIRFRLSWPPSGRSDRNLQELLEQLRRRGDPGEAFRKFLDPRRPGLKEYVTPLRPSEAVRTDVLGVRVAAVSPERAEDLGLEKGQGLYVASAYPGTIAHILGIGPGDVLLEVNGRPVAAADDVSAALAERTEGAPVTVVWIDAVGEKHTRSWRPAGK